LNAAGILTELHKRHFNSDSPDELWLATVGERGWAVITKDGKFRSRQVEIAALLRGRVAAFVLASGSATGADNAKAIIAAMPQMLGLLGKLAAPFIAKITASGAVEVMVTQAQIRRLAE
jgi:PIN domain-containing protein